VNRDAIAGLDDVDDAHCVHLVIGSKSLQALFYCTSPLRVNT